VDKFVLNAVTDGTLILASLFAVSFWLPGLIDNPFRCRYLLP
jgi:hypothetical protein